MLSAIALSHPIGLNIICGVEIVGKQATVAKDNAERSQGLGFAAANRTFRFRQA